MEQRGAAAEQLVLAGAGLGMSRPAWRAGASTGGRSEGW